MTSTLLLNQKVFCNEVHGSETHQVLVHQTLVLKHFFIILFNYLDAQIIAIDEFAIFTSQEKRLIEMVYNNAHTHLDDLKLAEDELDLITQIRYSDDYQVLTNYLCKEKLDDRPFLVLKNKAHAILFFPVFVEEYDLRVAQNQLVEDRGWQVRVQTLNHTHQNHQDIYNEVLAPDVADEAGEIGYVLAVLEVEDWHDVANDHYVAQNEHELGLVPKVRKQQDHDAEDPQAPVCVKKSWITIFVVVANLKSEVRDQKRDAHHLDPEIVLFVQLELLRL